VKFQSPVDDRTERDPPDASSAETPVVLDSRQTSIALGDETSSQEIIGGRDGTSSMMQSHSRNMSAGVIQTEVEQVKSDSMVEVSNVNESISVSHTIESVPEVPVDRFVTYKVHALDWYDVESRIKLICNNMLKPVAEVATIAKYELESQQSKLDKYSDDTEKLMDAVFFRSRNKKNIFHILQDQVTELKANEI